MNDFQKTNVSSAGTDQPGRLEVDAYKLIVKIPETFQVYEIVMMTGRVGTEIGETEETETGETETETGETETG